MHDNPINEILQLDRKAREMLKEAKATALDEKAKIHQNRQTLQVAYTKRADEHLTVLKQTYRTNIEEELAAAEVVFREQVEKLTEKYNSNHQSWEDTMFKRCLE